MGGEGTVPETAVSTSCVVCERDLAGDLHRPVYLKGEPLVGPETIGFVLFQLWSPSLHDFQFFSPEADGFRVFRWRFQDPLPRLR